MSLLIRNIRTLILGGHDAAGPVKGAQMAVLPQIDHAWLLIENDRVKAYGSTDTCPENADTEINAEGRFVLPAWCDSHSHIVFADSRDGEFVDRIKGLSYEEIAARGGGILHSAERLQQMPEDALYASALARLHEVIGQGTGALEIKSGYGLTTESELKMLRVIRRLKEHSPIPIKASFLGAHAIPRAYRAHREGYMQLLLEEMLPRVAGEGLADYVDVFCDKGFYTVEETDRILKAAASYGLKAKIHANELGYTGGVQVGVANGAVSVDHLEYCGPEEIACLLQSNTLPTLLPSCAFFLGIPFGPARQMIGAGLPVVLASDYNPGSSPSGKMSFVVSLACIKMGMLPEEAIQAATYNGACALELEAEYGSIRVGKKANFILTEPMERLAQMPYFFSKNWVNTTFIDGTPRQSPV
jgi:imidazolonepropionase